MLAKVGRKRRCEDCESWKWLIGKTGICHTPNLNSKRGKKTHCKIHVNIGESYIFQFKGKPNE